MKLPIETLVPLGALDRRLLRESEPGLRIRPKLLEDA